MRRTWMAAAMAGLALSGCGKGGNSTAAKTAAAVPAPASAPAAARPVRKAGLWEQTTEFGQVKQASRICLDAATDAEMGLQAKPADSPCSQSEVKPVAGGWEFAATCDLGEAGKMVSHGVATGDFGSAYRVEVESTTTGAAAPQMNGVRKFAIAAKWLGPCPADMKPGDIVLAGGMRITPGGAAGKGR